MEEGVKVGLFTKANLPKESTTIKTKSSLDKPKEPAKEHIVSKISSLNAQCIDESTELINNVTEIAIDQNNKKEFKETAEKNNITKIIEMPSLSKHISKRDYAYI
jgi:hypothetical protein